MSVGIREIDFPSRQAFVRLPNSRFLIAFVSDVVTTAAQTLLPGASCD
jgi:hypothetical protein